jgi:hypothetical protein
MWQPSQAPRLRHLIRIKSNNIMRQCWLKYITQAAFLCAVAVAGQTVHEVTPAPQPTGSYVAFKFDWDQGRPWVKYTISVDEAGNTRFHGIGNSIEDGDGDDYSLGFTMSAVNRQKIFELSKKVDYFQGNLEAKQKNIAQTGAKTLEYHRAGGAATSATYNYSPDPNVTELTRIFQAIATAVDFGRKLAFDYRFNKLGIDARLHSLQDLQASHYVEELQVTEPILQKIAADPNMMHINRLAARHLLKSIATSVPSGAPASQP